MPSSETLVTFEVRDQAGWITLNEPGKGNPFNLDSVAALREAISAAVAADVGVVVLGAQGRSFSVGGDLAAFRSADDPSAYLAELTGALHEQVVSLMEMDAIVVAAVHGTAAGAGVAFATSADLVLAAESARFTLAYTKVGLSPDGGTSLLERVDRHASNAGAGAAQPRGLGQRRDGDGLRDPGPSRRRAPRRGGERRRPARRRLSLGSGGGEAAHPHRSHRLSGRDLGARVGNHGAERWHAGWPRRRGCLPREAACRLQPGRLKAKA